MSETNASDTPETFVIKKRSPEDQIQWLQTRLFDYATKVQDARKQADMYKTKWNAADESLTMTRAAHRSAMEEANAAISREDALAKALEDCFTPLVSGPADAYAQLRAINEIVKAHRAAKEGA